MLSKQENQNRISYLKEHPITEALPDDEDADNPQADVKLVPKAEQAQRKLDEQKRREAALDELPREFIAELRKNDALVVTIDTLTKIAQNIDRDPHEIPEEHLIQRLAQITTIGRPGIRGPIRSRAGIEEKEGQPGIYFICYITEGGDIHKTVLDSANVPGFKEKLGSPVTKEQLRSLGIETFGRYLFVYHYSDLFAELLPNYLPSYDAKGSVEKFLEVSDAKHCTLEKLCQLLEQEK